MEKSDPSVIECQRLESLYSLNLLDSIQEPEFDELARLASLVANCKTALFSLIDEDRLWFKAKVGLDLSEVPKSESFCVKTMQHEGVFHVQDTHHSDEFKNNPYVTGYPNIRFYAGVSIKDPTGQYVVGTISVFDSSKKPLTDAQKDGLLAIRNQIERLLTSRANSIKLKDKEKSLNQASMKEESILKTAKLGSWDWWIGTNKLDYDERWFEILGISKDEAEKNLEIWKKRLHPEDKSKVFFDLQEHYEGRSSEYKNIHRLMHSSGEWIWVLDRGQVTEWDATGKPIRMTGALLDISSSVQEKALDDQIQSIAKIGGWQFDLKTHTLKCTKQVFDIYSLPPTRSLTKLTYNEYFAEKDKSRIRNCLVRCYRGQSFCEVFEFVDASGKCKFVEITGRPEKDSVGRVSKLIGTIQDLTEKILVEKQAEQSRIQATHSAKLASLGEMAAGIAHEINNPLAIILGSLGLLDRVKNCPESFSLKIQSIEKAVNRINRIVGGLRRFSRTEAYPQFKATPLNEIIKEALLITEIKSKKFNVPVFFNCEAELEIECDAIEIEQVIINLIGNGIDAAANHHEKWVKVDLSLSQEEKPVIRVIDSGLGLSEDLEQKVFNPFFTTKPVGQGTGLGLSICKGILDHHKAKIFVNRKFPNTCFEIQFAGVVKQIKVA